MIEWLKAFDKSLFFLINGWNSPFFDVVMWWVSKTLTWLPLYVLIVYTVVKKHKQQWWLPVVFVVLVITLADQISVHLFKHTFDRLRPCHNPEINQMVHLVNNSCGGKYGFVSSHAANTFAVSFFVFKLFIHQKSWVFIFLWALIVSYSRVYLGRHYPADVVAGGMLGVLIGWGTFCFYKTICRRLGYST